MASAWATLAAYLVMTIISYLLGKKHYPINYNLRAIGLFFMMALSFYFVSFIWADSENRWLKLLLNNLLVLLYLFLFYKLEFSNLKNIKSNAKG
jgi:hypothetical protein